MIPRRITLQGFLCYQDEQVIDFDGSDLWVLTGRNGSGKSAVFDAMTFALFGAHRGGEKFAANLINKDCDALAVAFDFDLGPSRYRIRRGLRRSGSSDRQVFRHEPDDDGTDRWPAVPETGSDAGFRRWVQETIGLTFETFTASVLLMQGRAENLVSATDKERFQILAGVVDLDRYERLHKAAERRRNVLKGSVEALGSQLRSLAPIDPAAVEEADRRADVAEAARVVADAQKERLLDVERRAREWSDLNHRKNEARGEVQRLQSLLDESEAIGRDWVRLRELDAVLPKLVASFDGRAQALRADEQSDHLEAERKEFDRKLDLMAGLMTDAVRHRHEVAAEIARDEARRGEIQARLAGLAAPMDRARRALPLRAEVRRLDADLATYPSGLDAELEAIEREHREATAAKAVFPTLERLASERAGLADARGRTSAAAEALAAVESEIGRLAGIHETRSAEAAATFDAEQRARDRATRATAHKDRAEDQFRRFEGLEGAPACDRCGQPLTAAHFAAELARLCSELASAQREAEEADRTHDEARRHRLAAESARDEAEVLLREARSTGQRERQRSEQAGRDVSHHARECARAYHALDEPYRTAVAPEPPGDWLATSYPTADDLAEARRLRDGIGGVEARLEEVRSRRDRRRTTRDALDRARHALGALGASPDDDSAAAAYDALAAEAEAIDRCLEGHRKEGELAEANLAHLETLKGSLGRDRSDRDRDLAVCRSLAAKLRADLARARSEAPEPWRAAIDSATAADLDHWRAERAALADRGVEAKAAAIPGTQLALKTAVKVLDDLDRQLAEVPAEARRQPAQVAGLLADARTALAAAEQASRTLRVEAGTLRDHLAQRQRVEDDARVAEGQLAIYETLARLLGRDGLQRHLLRDAERGILACANPILGEVSGGELELRLAEAGDAERALQLEALVRTHGSTQVLKVPYLSGSQKFRVAVSLALGIGRYARGLHRPIESVVIDEGFGCLDRQGRDEMIQQLGSLRGRLARIILVSHQEEFADAFADGYRFEVVEGATVVEPFHRG